MSAEDPPAAGDETTVRTKQNFIQAIVQQDIAAGKNDGKLVTRFPPEPNGYLHVGHAKAICLNFGLAEEFGGRCNLRFDDTNPAKEEQEYVDSIQSDIAWLGFDWGGQELYASNYFEQLYAMAEQLIGKGVAYVCDLSPEQTREYRGTVTKVGTDSPFRDRTVEENLDYFRRMRAGEFEDGARTLRAKIDMASPNMNMRDPVMYRILRATHHRTGDTWCVYPMYDFAHGQSDAIEGVSHSLCTLEFENHRPLYDWFLDHLDLRARPEQTEFARLNLTYTITSKRKLLELVEGRHVSGWDDPRMPTIQGLRRRGYTPESVREFCSRIGVARFNSTVDMVQLENALRDDLNQRAERRMAVLRPLKVVIENYPEDKLEEREAINNPEDESAGTRSIPLTREIYIERDDFREDAPRKYFRLAPDRDVRLRYGYVIHCNEVVKDERGEVTELRCTYLPETADGQPPEDGRKVKGIIHWVSAAHGVTAEVRLYDHLFSTPHPGDVPEGGDCKDNLNPSSLEVLQGCRLERGLADAKPGDRYQFERLGYFSVDPIDSRPDSLVFNRAVSLRDSWAKIEKKGSKK
ncbi:MAG: glutamine--tRNA ligase/YqeY domain fusion protein [bacterium]|nr:glutamine--tRNA ligase/YqeY domain fusion protein [bacterium]